MSPRASLLLLATLLSGGAAQAAEDELAQVSPLIITAQVGDGYLPGRLDTALRVAADLRDTPQSIGVVSAQLIRDQAMQSMADVLRYVPGATIGQGEGHRDAPSLRGNASTADFFVDGVRDDVQYYRDLYNTERVEVLLGPNAMIFGRGGGGGVINRVTRVADGRRHVGLSLEGGDFEHRRMVGDLGAAMNETVSARVNLMHERSGSYRDFVNLERWGVNPSVTYQGASGFTATLTFERFVDDRTTDRGAPSFQGRPLAIPVNAYFGDPTQSWSRVEADSARLAFDLPLNADLTLRHRTVWGAYDKGYGNVYASGAAVADAQGRPAVYPLQAYRSFTERTNVFSQSDLVWTHGTDGARRTIVAGLEVGRQDTRNLRETGRFGGPAGSTTLTGVLVSEPTRRNLPVAYANSGSDAQNTGVADVAALFAQAQADLGPRVQLIAGLRYDVFSLDLRDERASVTGRRDFSRTDRIWSPRLGLVVRPVEPLSIYASYSVSSLPASGDQFASLSISTESLKPESFRNLEAGFKVDLTPRLMATGAVYQLDRENTQAPDPLVPGRVVQTGAQRSTGLELGLGGKVTDRWETVATMAVQSARITRQTAAAPVGRHAALTPEFTASLWNKVEVTPRLSLGLGVIHQGDMFASISNTVTLPGFTRVDGAVFLRVGEDYRLQLNVENLGDITWSPTSHGDNNIQPGAPRTVRISISRGF
ncbi:TonB-dependent receptor [Phenylobacterium parvum]|uniref:TonB-dependent siderophore receptor n=1 Tax=Phenylobacterium parvum TaxID=2201350 RepID=A0A2Z3HN67_9CAUL|nr:TonB-dependent siderophore receptor [Phenylobacterium parvum]AWM77167.1 TonB-dependent siderophore receptor [Phenylobacterium parvum]